MSKLPKKSSQSSSEKTSTKKHVVSALKLIFVVGLLYILVKKGFISVEAMQKALSNWKLILLAFVIISITQVLSMWRWKILLEGQGIFIKAGRVLQLALIGNFFNIALPGAVSGDFVKAFYIGREVPGKRSRAFGSIMFDRVAGVSALVMVSAGGLCFQYKQFNDSPLVGAIGAFIAIAACCVLAFYTYLFMVKEKHDAVLILFRNIEKKVPRIASLTRVYEGLRHYHNHRLAVLKVLVISCIVHLNVCWCCLLFAQALGDFSLDLLSVFIVVPLGLLVIAIPVAPAGVGTGNVAFLYLFGLIGSGRGADVYSLFALMNIFYGFIGGLVYFNFRSHQSTEGQHQLWPESGISSSGDPA